VCFLERFTGICAYDCAGDGGELIVGVGGSGRSRRLLRETEWGRNGGTDCEQSYGNQACAHVTTSFEDTPYYRKCKSVC
jgi:hypothetical protein